MGQLDGSNRPGQLGSYCLCNTMSSYGFRKLKTPAATQITELKQLGPHNWMGDHSSVEVDAIVKKYGKNLRSGDTKYIFLGRTKTKSMSVRFVPSSCARSTD